MLLAAGVLSLIAVFGENWTARAALFGVVCAELYATVLVHRNALGAWRAVEESRRHADEMEADAAKIRALRAELADKAAATMHTLTNAIGELRGIQEQAAQARASFLTQLKRRSAGQA